MAELDEGGRTVHLQASQPAADNDRNPRATEKVLAEEALAIDPHITDPLLVELARAPVWPPGERRDQKLGVSGDPIDVSRSNESAEKEHSLYQALGGLERAALCLSGGGIRSAAFGLGVIQALAAHPRPREARALFAEPHQAEEKAPHPRGRENTVATADGSLLAHLQYLSTVSGGGYIGSWLSVWRNRGTFAAVWGNLVGRPGGPDVEPGTFAWLRAYSNYLTPKLGALSGDTWAGIAISLRNLLLNWLVILPAICVVLLLLKMIATVSIGIAVLPPSNWLVAAFAVVAALLLVIALRFATRARPSRRLDDVRAKGGLGLGVTQGSFIRWDLLPAALAAGVLIQLAASNSGLALTDHHSQWVVIAVAALIGGIIYALSWIAACLDRRDGKDFWLWALTGVVYGALLGTGAYLYNVAPSDDYLLFNDLLLPVMVGVPWILVSQAIAEMVFVGLSSYQAESDSDREWLGRAAGWYLVTAIGWFAVTFLVFAGSRLMDDFAYHLRVWIAPLGGLGGIVTAVLGKSSLSQGRGQEAKGAKPLSTGIILAIAAPVFAAALIIVLSAALDELLLHDSLVMLLRYPGRGIVIPGWCLMALPLVIGLVISAAIGRLAAKLRDPGRFVILVLVAPVIATAAVMLLAELNGPAAPVDASVDSWQLVLPLWLGGAIAGIFTWGVARRGRIPPTSSWRLALLYALASFVLIPFVAAAIDFLASPLALEEQHRGLDVFSPGWFDLFGPLLVGGIVLVAVGWIASAAVNINRFSLHAVYRNRLVRAFLGASRPRRYPDRFTGFDPGDNPPMSALWPPRRADGTWPAGKDWRPFHVINMALNVVSTKRLSWQERKAEAFTVSPLHSGSACKAYRRSQDYGGDKGISLGTAMAISGAAASPNMGYHSSPAITFLLALFNVRLGWWFGNPGAEGNDTYHLEGPALALQPLIEETFGLTTDNRPYVYLSDGGHFENLGIYEMVRRRCRYIIAVDAGADPDYGFEDLGNAVRKIAIDLGVTIRFHGLEKLEKRPADGHDVGPHKPYHAIGEINYPAADGGGELGTILYIKAGYHGVEDAGVRAYAMANPTFPHQSTIDQFFSESQFESYRSLGFGIADGIFNHALEKLGDHERSSTTLRDIFARLREVTKEKIDEDKRKEAAKAPHPPLSAPPNDARGNG